MANHRLIVTSVAAGSMWEQFYAKKGICGGSV